jgi:hypothetical protein
MKNENVDSDSKLVPASQSSESWLSAGHQDSDFIARVQADIDALSRLETNWDGYGAPRMDPKVIEAAKQFVIRLPDDLVRRPHVVPLSTGMLQLEWHDGPKTLELEFESPQSIRFLQWNPAGGVEEEDSISVHDIDRAIDLIHWFTSGA